MKQKETGGFPARGSSGKPLDSAKEATVADQDGNCHDHDDEPATSLDSHGHSDEPVTSSELILLSVTQLLMGCTKRRNGKRRNEKREME